ncbi:MAG: serine protein kinase RIO [Candidatus Bathyarchaeota archaeon]|nr:serine protein kinase RIO [Candidatus Bathyarchaeota archaeon]
MSRKVKEKLAHRERQVERRDKMLIHDFKTERATIEEVFDQATLLVLYRFLNSGVINEVNGVVSAGKEARVYWAKNKQGEDLAVKIYLTSSAEFKRGMIKYIEGDQRFKGVKRDTKSLISAWAQKEFKNLEQATSAKVRVPKPIAVESNVLIMEFIGEAGVSAPSLKEQPPENAEKVYSQLLRYMERLYRKAELVHGDLSEYNLIIWKGKLVMFDMSQSVPISHPLAQFLLNRDITNVNRFFSRLGVKVLSNEEVYRKVAG